MVRGVWERAWYLASAVLIACGSHSVSHGGKKGNSDTGGTAGSGHSGGTAGTGHSGTSGTTEPGGGEGGAEDGGDGGSSPTGGRGGSVGTGGSGPGHSTGGRGGQAGGIGGQAGGVGGQAGSGGSSGSSGAGGSGGRLPLPDGCVVQSGAESSSQCTLSATCNGTPNTALCFNSGSGVSRCQCTIERKDRYFEIDAPGLASCAVAIGLCSQDELELGAETCSASGDGDLNECSAGLTCGRPITVGFAPGVEASLMTYAQGGCWRDAAGLPFNCNCEIPSGHVDYGVLAESGENACGPLLEFCMSGNEPEFEGPTECFDTQRSSDSSACSLSQVCTTPMRLTDDVRLADLVTRRSSCDRISSGSDCTCSVTDWYSTFDFKVSAVPSANTCTLAAANCDKRADIRPIGEPDCQPVSQTAYADSCYAIYNCPQEATVDGRDVLATGYLGLACARVASGQPWRCSCASGEATAIFELGSASSSSWDVCGLAFDPCFDRVSVHIGAYGPGGTSPPDPLGDP